MAATILRPIHRRQRVHALWLYKTLVQFIRNQLFIVLEQD